VLTLPGPPAQPLFSNMSNLPEFQHYEQKDRVGGSYTQSGYAYSRALNSPEL
jgi:hypothetical protein